MLIQPKPKKPSSAAAKPIAGGTRFRRRRRFELIFYTVTRWGYDAPLGDLGTTSAGCLVGRTKNGHRKFMELIKDDPRYNVNNSYRFVTAVMPGDEILA